MESDVPVETRRESCIFGQIIVQISVCPFEAYVLSQVEEALGVILIQNPKESVVEGISKGASIENCSYKGWMEIRCGPQERLQGVSCLGTPLLLLLLLLAADQPRTLAAAATALQWGDKSPLLTETQKLTVAGTSTQPTVQKSRNYVNRLHQSNEV
ncbi:hypothetical protein Taro_043735 [Colocasia esculenta]|uniref:Uncharacterized protein n=1 Tax=Colocasia esculenta TaxID=4460 RepID=A0A843WLV4_COLES|nr:hypothetical protein [Colocasia esculenta]